MYKETSLMVCSHHIMIGWAINTWKRSKHTNNHLEDNEDVLHRLVSELVWLVIKNIYLLHCVSKPKELNIINWNEIWNFQMSGSRTWDKGVQTNIHFICIDNLVTSLIPVFCTQLFVRYVGGLSRRHGRTRGGVSNVRCEETNH